MPEMEMDDVSLWLLNTMELLLKDMMKSFRLPNSNTDTPPHVWLRNPLAVVSDGEKVNTRLLSS